MPFYTTAQELIVVEEHPKGSFGDHMHSVEHQHDLVDHVHEPHLSVEDVPVSVEGPIHVDIEHADIEFNLGNVPGAPHAAEIVVEEEPLEKDKKVEVVEDKNDAFDINDAKTKKSKKSEKWDWESKGASGFLTWIKERVDDVPKHSGMDTSGLERAISYLDKLDGEISKAMRSDVDGELDANKIEEVRSKIEDGLERLQERLDKIKKTKKMKKSSEVHSLGLIKEAQKITGVKGIMVTVPLLISRIARVCINGMVSAGHDIERIYKQQVEYYNLNKREQAELVELLFDMGYPMRLDRGYMPEDALEVSSNDGIEWAANYKG